MSTLPACQIDKLGGIIDLVKLDGTIQTNKKGCISNRLIIDAAQILAACLLVNSWKDFSFLVRRKFTTSQNFKDYAVA